jgi:hypothetical protein
MVYECEITQECTFPGASSLERPREIEVQCFAYGPKSHLDTGMD